MWPYYPKNFKFQYPNRQLEGSTRSVVTMRAKIRKLHLAFRMLLSTSMDWSGPWLTFPLENMKSCACFYTRPAASRLNMATVSIRNPSYPHIMSVLASRRLYQTPHTSLRSRSSYNSSAATSSSYSISFRDIAGVGHPAVAVHSFPSPPIFSS